jgi:hypothetical protein
MPRQQRPQPGPLRIGQVMPFQAILIHDPIQAETIRQDLQDTL